VTTDESLDSRVRLPEVRCMLRKGPSAYDHDDARPELADDWSMIAPELAIVRNSDPAHPCDVVQPLRIISAFIEVLIVEFDVESVVGAKSAVEVNPEIDVDEEGGRVRRPHT